jgi:hypothetical protein
MKILATSLSVLLSTTSLGFAAGFEILKPHRAVYDVTLENAEERSGIKGMKGRIVYEVQGNECDGISIRYRFVTTITTGRDDFTTDQQTATYESPDGKEFSFETKSFVNDQADQKISGNASVRNDGVIVNLKGEEPRQLNLGEGIFTTSHLVDILNAAAKGDQFLNHNVFDGSGDADKMLSSASVIGKPKLIEAPLEGESSEILEVFSERKAWPVTMSYFEPKQDNTGEALPIYEASFLLYGDGLTRQLKMRYPDYELQAALTKVEYFDSTACKLEN